MQIKLFLPLMALAYAPDLILALPTKVGYGGTMERARGESIDTTAGTDGRSGYNKERGDATADTDGRGGYNKVRGEIDAVIEGTDSRGGYN